MRRNNSPARTSPRRRPSRRPQFDPLESRAVPSVAAEFAAVFPIGGSEGTVTVRKAIAGTGQGPIVVGSFTGTVDFDPGPAVFNLTSAGGEDAFIARYDRLGRLRWAQRFGGEGDDRANDVIAPYNDDVTVVGSFTGTVNYQDVTPPPTIDYPGIDQLQSEGGTDAFVLAMSSLEEGVIRWAKSFGGPGDDEANGLAYSYDSLVIVGAFSGTANFDPYYRLPGSPHTLTSVGGTDAFVLALAAGAWWWEPSSLVVRAGGPGDDAALALSGNGGGRGLIYAGDALSILGTFTGTADLSFEDGLHVATYYTPKGPDYRTSAGLRDVFLARLVAPFSMEPQFLKTFGGPGDESPKDFEIVNEGATSYSIGRFYYYVAGAFEGESRFDDDAASRRVAAGGTDGFLARYDAQDGALEWVETLSGPGDDSVEAIVADSAGVSATGGFTGGLDFDPGAARVVLQGGAAGSAFLWQLTGDGALRSARALGGPGSSRGLGLTYLGWDEFYVAGRFAGSVDFDPRPTTRVVASAGASDGFFAKFQLLPDMIPVAVDDMYRATAGQELKVRAYESWAFTPVADGLLANDRTRHGPQTGSARLETFAKDGYALIWDHNGAVSYVPDDGFTGLDSFTYVIRDGDLTSNAATVYVDVVAAGPAPADRSEVAIDRGGDGTWSWTAAGGWAQVSTVDPQNLATGSDGTLYLDLGSRGLWAWADGRYRKLNDADPQAIVAGPNGVLAVDYGRFGLWSWSAGAMSLVNAADPEGVAFGPDGALYVDYGPYGLWTRRENAGLRLLSAANPEGVSAGPGGALYVDFGPYGLWDWSENRGFRRLIEADARAIAVATDGTLLVDFGVYGLWSRREAAGFARVGERAVGMSPGASGVLYVDFGAGGVSRWIDGALRRLDG